MINNLTDSLSRLTQRLNRRERYLVFTALVVVTIFAGARVAVLPFAGQADRLKHRLADKQSDYREIVELAREYQAVAQAVEGEISGLANRRKDFTLFSLLDRLAGETGVKQNIAYMRPSTSDSPAGDYQLSLVEMKLDAVSLEQLVSFLYRIENSQNAVFVKRLSIARLDTDAGGVDALMQVETIIDSK